MFNIEPPPGAVKHSKRLGRGNGSGRGGTSGRGSNGQNSRTSGGVRPGFEGGQMPLYRRIARRGFSNYPHKKKIPEVYLRDIDARFSEGELINPALLKQAGLISGCPPGVKILSNGGITKKFKFESLAFSASAREKILAAGGEIAGEEGKNGG